MQGGYAQAGQPQGGFADAVLPKAGWVWKKGGSKSETASHSGILKKAQGKTQWKKRWLQVKGNGCVVWMKDPMDAAKVTDSDGVHLRLIQIRDNLGQREGLSSKEHGFSLVGNGREVLLGALSAKDKDEWLQYLVAMQRQILGDERADALGLPTVGSGIPPRMALDLSITSPGESPGNSPMAPGSSRALASPLAGGMPREKVGWMLKKQKADEMGTRRASLEDLQAAGIGKKDKGGLSGAGAKAKARAKRGWKRRWFMVRGTSLVYYKTAEDATLGNQEKERLELFQAQIRDNLGAKEGSSSQKFGFSIIIGGGREFHLACENDREKQEWISYLEAVAAVATAPVRESVAPQLAQGWLLKKGGSKASSSQDGGDAGAAGRGGESDEQSEEEKLRELFNQLDQDGDGALSAKELRVLARELGRELTKGELEALLSEMGIAFNQSMTVTVSYEAFRGWWLVNKNKGPGGGPLGGLNALKNAKSAAPTRRNWARRWFVIEGFDLVYYKDAKTAARRENERGRIKLNSFTVCRLQNRQPNSSGQLPGASVGAGGGEAEISSSIEKNGKAAAFVLTDGRRSMLLAAEDDASQDLWLKRLRRTTNAIWAAGETTGLPGQLKCSGQFGSTAAEWLEASRDFTRTFVSGSSDMLLIGANSDSRSASPVSIDSSDGAPGDSSGGLPQLGPIACTINAGGNVNEEVNAAAVAEFESEIASAVATAAVAADLSELTKRLIGHLTVTPAMQLLLDCGVSPAMFQNKFVVLVTASGDVRVATYGFIGEPARGDRPDRKSTPFVLRMLTGNLCESVDASTGASNAPTEQVQYAVQRTNAEMIDEVIADDRGRMLAAVTRVGGGDSFAQFLDLASGNDDTPEEGVPPAPPARPVTPQASTAVYQEEEDEDEDDGDFYREEQGEGQQQQSIEDDVYSGEDDGDFFDNIIGEMADDENGWGRVDDI